MLLFSVIILGASTLLIRPNLTNHVITCSTVIAKPGGLKGIASVKLGVTESCKWDSFVFIVK